MNETLFAELFEQFIENIWLQGAIIAVAVCFLEDGARCAVGLLVAAGRVNWWWSVIWMMIGSIAGDIGLYLIGRYLLSFCVEWGWIKIERIEKMKAYFGCHVIKALFLARFVPGVRTVVFLAAGGLRYRFLKFLIILSCITFLQILIFLYATEFIGESVAVYLADKRLRWMVAGFVVLLIMVVHFVVSRCGKQKIVKTVEKL